MALKAVPIQNLPKEAWTFVTGDIDESSVDKLFSTISWLYRCVTIRGNSVSAMPFEVRKGENVVYEYDGVTPQGVPPKEIRWIADWPRLANLVEVASCLGGRAYIERQKNKLGSRDFRLHWLTPHSVEPILNGVPGSGGLRNNPDFPYGEVLGFWRTIPYIAKIVELDIDDVLYFWLPDHASEVGPATNYPGKAVLQNAGVIGSLDVFLKGYFDRGLIKATLLKYKDAIKESEARRVREWWRRAFSGVNNAHATRVVRGDFETLTIGDGIETLRDNALLKDERDAIAVGMGIPPSKLLPVGVNRATKDGDDRGYIEDTIIPEIIWIYRELNNQVLNPLGYSIVALPQQLRVMQTDEVERSQAFSNYRNGGYSIDEAESILGIYVAEDVKQAAEQQREENRQQFQQKHIQGCSCGECGDEKSLDLLDLLDKRDEKAQFERWMKNREYKNIDVDDFKTQHLTKNEKLKIAFGITPRYKNKQLDNLVEGYGESLARVVRANWDKTKQEFTNAMILVVGEELNNIFSIAVGATEDEPLTVEEHAEFRALLQDQSDFVTQFVDDLYASKGVLFDTVATTLQGLGLGNRLALWKNAARQFFNRGLLIGRREAKMTWRLGNTEEHCEDCLRFNGKTASKSEWLNLAGVGFYPQSRNLQCKGYNCDCFMEFE